MIENGYKFGVETLETNLIGGFCLKLSAFLSSNIFGFVISSSTVGSSIEDFNFYFENFNGIMVFYL